MKKMRGVIDPYTLGFLLSLIGATSVYITHDNKQNDEEIERSVHIKMQVVNLTQTEDFKEIFD